MSEAAIRCVRRLEPMAILQVRNGVFWVEDGKGRSISPARISSARAWADALAFLEDGGAVPSQEKR